MDRLGRSFFAKTVFLVRIFRLIRKQGKHLSKEMGNTQNTSKAGKAPQTDEFASLDTTQLLDANFVHKWHESNSISLSDQASCQPHSTSNPILDELISELNRGCDDADASIIQKRINLLRRVEMALSPYLTRRNKVEPKKPPNDIFYLSEGKIFMIPEKCSLRNNATRSYSIIAI